MTLAEVPARVPPHYSHPASTVHLLGVSGMCIWEQAQRQTQNTLGRSLGWLENGLDKQQIDGWMGT